MERGVRRLEIYKEEEDYQIFLMILKKTLKKKECILHAYCLMTNHFHLLIETGSSPIGEAMKILAGEYAAFYNHKYKYRGHVFEGRFKSGIVETDQYFLQTGKYIHLNPVKAQMVEHPEDYPWSSYRSMIYMRDDGVTQSNKTLLYFKHNLQKYRNYIEDTAHTYVFDEKKIQKQIGDDEEWLPW